jgi:hypothetical protein
VNASAQAEGSIIGEGTGALAFSVNSPNTTPLQVVALEQPVSPGGTSSNPSGCPADSLELVSRTSRHCENSCRVAETDEAPKGIRDFVVKTAWLAWGALVALIIAGVAGAIYVAATRDPSITEQLAEIRKEAASDSARTVVNRRMDLRGTGEKAHLLVFRDDRVLSALGVRRVRFAPSDEIRIYEEVDGELRLRFRFQPEVPPSQAPYVFTLESAGDRDGNGRPEVIGAYARVAMRAFMPTPVVLSWDDARGAYALYPLLYGEPSLRRVADPGLYGRTARSRYRRPVLLEDRRTTASVRGFGAESIALAVSDGAVKLMTSYVQQAATHAARKRFEVAAWVVDLQRPRPEGFQCQVLPETEASAQRFYPTISVVGGEEGGEGPSRQSLQRLWRDQRHRFAC